MDQYKKRHNARIIAAQCLYSIMLNPQKSWQDVLQHITSLPQNPLSIYDQDFAENLIEDCLAKSKDYEENLSPYLKHGIESLHPIERVILWIACQELNQKPLLVTKAIILNEALTLIRELSEEKSVKFINAMLDRYAADLGL